MVYLIKPCTLFKGVRSIFACYIMLWYRHFDDVTSNIEFIQFIVQLIFREQVVVFTLYR